MADRIRIGRFDENKRFTSLLDVNDQTTYALVKDTLNFVSPEAQQQLAVDQRRYAGARVVGETHDNGHLEAEWYISGTSRDAALANADALVSLLSNPDPGLYVEDRPDGASNSVYYELRGPGAPRFVRSWARWISNSTVHLAMVAPTAPLPFGDWMDIRDDFSAYTIGGGSFVSRMANVLAGGTTPLYWTLGDPSNATFADDSSPNNRDGTPAGGPVFGAASIFPKLPGTAVQFDGNDDRITSSAYTFANGGVHTIGGWSTRDTAATTTQHLAAFGSSGAIRSTAAGTTLLFEPQFGGGGVPVTIPATGPFFWSVVFDELNNTVEWFINGESQGVTTGFAPTWQASATNFQLGNSTNGWPGKHQHVFVTNYALTPSQIQSIYQVGRYGSGDTQDYTADAGGVNLYVRDKQVFSNSTSEQRRIHTAKGYKYSDVQVSLGVFTGSVASYDDFVGLILARQDANNYLRIGYTGTTAKIQKIVNGAAPVDLASNGPLSVAANTYYTIRARREGRRFIFERSVGRMTPTTGTEDAAYTLTDAEAALFPDGQVGFDWDPTSGTTGNYIDHFEVDAYSYRGRVLPERLVLPSIPGSAPAQVDMEFTEAPSSKQPWAMFGWANAERNRNMVWNGDFETNAEGWSVAAVGGVAAAATSVARTTTQFKYGGASGQVVVPGTVADEGTTFAIPTKTRAGDTYTLEAWVRLNVAGPMAMKLRIGKTGGFINTSPATNVTNQWQKLTVTGTHNAADLSVLYAAIIMGQSSPVTFFVDGVRLYPGQPTDAPTLGTQVEGRGAYSPIGAIDAESSVPSLTTGFSSASDATRRNGNVMQWTTSGAGTAQLGFFVDPSLIDMDDFTVGDLMVEVWGVVRLANTLVAPTLAVSAYGPSTLVPRRTAREGTRSLVLPTSTAWRPVRLGSINLGNPDITTWNLLVTAGVAAGSSGVFSLDYLMLVPAQRRMAFVSGKANDTAYPDFIPVTTEMTRGQRADGTSTLRVPSQERSQYPAASFGGALPEFGPGPVTLLFTSLDLVPDDPTSNANSLISHGNTATIHASVRPRYYNGRG